MKHAKPTGKETFPREITLFPNPASSALYFTCRPYLHVDQVKIFNIVGAHIETTTASKNNIDISLFDAGWYLLQLEIKSEFATNYSKEVIFKQ